VLWLERTRNTSAVFVLTLQELQTRCPHAVMIHVISGNCRIPDSKITHAALRAFPGRMHLHFLHCTAPPTITSINYGTNYSASGTPKRQDTTSLQDQAANSRIIPHGHLGELIGAPASRLTATTGSCSPLTIKA